jgi:hypothetical protein
MMQLSLLNYGETAPSPEPIPDLTPNQPASTANSPSEPVQIPQPSQWQQEQAQYYLKLMGRFMGRGDPNEKAQAMRRHMVSWLAAEREKCLSRE